MILSFQITFKCSENTDHIQRNIEYVKETIPLYFSRCNAGILTYLKVVQITFKVVKNTDHFYRVP